MWSIPVQPVQTTLDGTYKTVKDGAGDDFIVETASARDTVVFQLTGVVPVASTNNISYCVIRGAKVAANIVWDTIGAEPLELFYTGSIVRSRQTRKQGSHYYKIVAGIVNQSRNLTADNGFTLDTIVEIDA